jgi:hypothetical protein
LAAWAVPFAELVGFFDSKVSTGCCGLASFFGAAAGFGSALGAGLDSTLGAETGREVLPLTGAT